MASGTVATAEGVTLHVGDEVRQVVSITATRDFDFVSLSMPRPACFEPKAFTSGYTALGDLSGYRAIGDTQTRFFVDRLPKGSYTLAETYTVSRSGRYLIPRTGVSCAYAPNLPPQCPAAGEGRITPAHCRPFPADRCRLSIHFDNRTGFSCHKVGPEKNKMA